MLGLAEAVSIARSVATRSHQRIDSNQEFIGQGLSNIVGSFFSSYAASGSFTRTGLNYEVGAKTPMAAVYAAVTLAAVLLLIAPLTAYLPIASMAGVLLLVAYGLVDMHHIKTIVSTSKQETAVLAVTFLATLLVELEFAIYVGVILSLLLYLNRTSHPHFVTLVPDPDSNRRSFVNILKKPSPECPQLKIIRIDGSLFFGAVNHIAEATGQDHQAEPRAGPYPDRRQRHQFYRCGRMRNARRRGPSPPPERKKALSLLDEGRGPGTSCGRGGYLDRIGEENIFLSKVQAMKRIVLHRLDPERCRHCHVRIFTECSQMPQEPMTDNREKMHSAKDRLGAITRRNRSMTNHLVGIALILT